MFKKVLYVIFAVLLGFIVYTLAYVTLVGNYQRTMIKEESTAENYEFFLKMVSKYNPTPVYESTDGKTKLRIYEVYQAAAENTESDLGYMIIIFGVNETVSTTPNDKGEDKSAIKFTGTSLENEAIRQCDGELSLNLASLGEFGTVYPFLAYGLNTAFNNYLFANKSNKEENGTTALTIINKANTQTLESIEFRDCDGEVFYTIEQTFNIGSLSVESMTASGMTDDERKAFSNPGELIWKQALIMAGYMLIAVGLGWILFKKPKQYHASATEFGGNKPSSYDAITESAKEERVTKTDASSEVSKEEPEEVEVVESTSEADTATEAENEEASEETENLDTEEEKKE